MNLELIAALTGPVLGFTGLVCACISYRRSRSNRELVEFTFNRVEELEHGVAEINKKLEAATIRNADQARRIAWLETRIRRPKLAKKDILDEAVLSDKPAAAPTITERRYRVLTLARSGQSADTISKTLGMLPGEVELIINLNRANYA